MILRKLIFIEWAQFSSEKRKTCRKELFFSSWPTCEKFASFYHLSRFFLVTLVALLACELFAFYFQAEVSSLIFVFFSAPKVLLGWIDCGKKVQEYGKGKETWFVFLNLYFFPESLLLSFETLPRIFPKTSSCLYRLP